MSPARPAAPLLALAASLSFGCTTSMSIRSLEPGAVHVGSTNHLVILAGEGRRSAREFVNMEVLRQSRARGYFSAADRSEEGLEVRVAGRRATVEGGDFALEADQAGLRIDVLEWVGYRDEDEVRGTDEAGKEYVELVQVLRGNVLLALTLFDATGRAFLAEAEYEGWATGPVDAPREEVIERAAASAVAGFLGDVTPVHVVTRVRLDEEDEGQKPILATARGGAVALAARDMRAYFEAHPMSASAAYNLAVLLEATGDFVAALEMYDTALSLGGKDYYAAARAGCARRLAASESLSTGEPATP